MGARENPAQRESWLALGLAGAKVFRINTGRAWAGKGKRQRDGSVVIAYPQLVCLGYADVRNEPIVGTGDLAGWLPVVVTQEMVGHTIAVYLAAEAKPADTGRASKEQLDHIALVQRDGGIAGVVRGKDCVQRLLTSWFDRFRQKSLT